MVVNSSVVAAIAAVAGCFVVTLVFSLLAVAVHRRAGRGASTTRGAGSGTAASQAAWSKVATADVSSADIDSPLYSAVVGCDTASNVASQRNGNGKMASELCGCEGPDIILTLESEPVNYAVSSGPDLRVAGGGPGPRPPTNRGSPTKPLNF